MLKHTRKLSKCILCRSTQFKNVLINEELYLNCVYESLCNGIETHGCFDCCMYVAFLSQTNMTTNMILEQFLVKVINMNQKMGFCIDGLFSPQLLNDLHHTNFIF